MKSKSNPVLRSTAMSRTPTRSLIAAVYGEDYQRMRRESRHHAHVIVTMGGAPGLALFNAESFRTPFGPPTVQVSSVERDRVFAALERNAKFRVVVQTRRSTTQARNVVLTVAGRDRDRPPWW